MGEGKEMQRPMANGELEIAHRTALKYMPGVDGIRSGDPFMIAGAAQAPFP